MNIRNFNFNLLKSLYALLTEKNVSIAAKKTFITQPAMSNILNQLRGLLNDELLVRQGRSMILTPKAEGLLPKVKNILLSIEATFSDEEVFYPLQSNHTFTLGMTDYIQLILLPKLAKYLDQNAPNIILKIKPVNEFHLSEEFMNNEIDLVIGLAAKSMDGVEMETLFSERAVCVARLDHPLMKGNFTLKKYLSAEHIAIVLQENLALTVTNQALQEKHLVRQVKIEMSHMIPLLFTLPQTSYIATLPEQLAKLFIEKLELNIKDPPFKIPSTPIKMIWKKHYSKDVKHQWLRGVLLSLCKDI